MPTGNYVKFIEGYLQEQGSATAKRNRRHRLARPAKFSAATTACINLHVGQRKGLGLSGGQPPMYVVALDRAAKSSVVGEDQELRRTTCEVRDVNWIPYRVPDQPVQAMVRIRNRHEPAAAEITPLDATTARVTFPRARSAPSPPAKPRYSMHDEKVLGGGWIR